MAELVSTVHVADETGVIHVFGPGDDVPDWAVDKIDNPKAWSPDPHADDDEGNGEKKPKAPTRSRAPKPKD